MKSDTPLDYAVFQLSPKRSRCELFVSSDGNTEKVASGLLKPFVAHLKVAEEQVAAAARSVKLDAGRRKWFNKGTLERFVRYVSTPEILELVNNFDAEMSQLEAARRIYSQGAGDGLSGGAGSDLTAADDATKKELLRAIDVRLVALQQDLSTTCARAAAAGFNVDTVSELQMFADRFCARRLIEACSKFMLLCEKRPDLINSWKPGPKDQAVRSSYGSDMSIDDDSPSPPPHQKPATHRPPNPAPVASPLHGSFSRESSVETEDRNKPDDVREKDNKDETSIPEEPVPLQPSQPSRRLSVQDRINMFESKQKENSGGKPVVVKSVELRRMSSDVSSMGPAAEKAVLRRWSGASDMSIDLSADKDNESPSCTPSSRAVPQENKVLNLTTDEVNGSAVKPEIKIIPSLGRVGERGFKEGSSNKSEQFFESGKSNPNFVPGESDGLNDSDRGKTLSRSYLSNRVDNQENSDEKFKILLDGQSDGMVGIRDQRKLKHSYSAQELDGPHSQFARVNNQSSSLTQSRAFQRHGSGQVFATQKEDSESRDEPVMQTHINATGKTIEESTLFEGVSGSRIQGNLSQQEVKSAGETAEMERKESRASQKFSTGSVSTTEDSGPQKTKPNRQGLAAELSKKEKVKQDESSVVGNSRKPFSGKVMTEAREGYDSFTTPPPDQAQRVRQSKGNQELHDELKMKANELEKLFAEHKLRGPGDQSNSVRKGKSENIRYESESSLQYSKADADISPQLSIDRQSTDLTGSMKNKTEFSAASLMKPIDVQNYHDTLSKNFSELSVSESSRGKLYDSYMQRRDAKLREDWSSNRAEKEARLKSMQDSLERSRSKMKATLSGSADRQDSVSSVRRRAERLRSYNSRSIMKREQRHLEFGDSNDDEEAIEFLDKNLSREDRALDDTSFGNGISRGVQGKKILPNNRSLSSSTPRNSAAPVPRSASKISTSNSGKRRMQPENPLAQSVPNFSDLRKENTKPSSGGFKTTRSQERNYNRSKSINDEATTTKEDQSRRPQALRKSSANPSELQEMSPQDTDVVVPAPINCDELVLKSGGTKPFLKKGSRAGFTRASLSRRKGSVGSELEPVSNVEENYDLIGADEFGSIAKDEGEDEFEELNADVPKTLDHREPIVMPESENFVDSGSENCDDLPTFSRVDQALGSQLPTDIPSSFLPVDSMRDWPGESPTSWNAHLQHPFSYPQEISDVDASVDSPLGSPASWNSQSLNQMESDAARMRKKWGTAQKPMLVTHSSNNLSRKDRTRGFKRLLKFGRKSRGSESLVDWISATTSEGDDDTEDGRDPANRSSDDLRKSRMGFAQAQPSDDSFNESEFFNESVQSSESSIPAPPANFKLRDNHMSGSSIKAPRSFFSSSLFRSKGSDSKPR